MHCSAASGSTSIALRGQRSQQPINESIETGADGLRQTEAATALKRHEAMQRCPDRASCINRRIAGELVAGQDSEHNGHGSRTGGQIVGVVRRWRSHRCCIPTWVLKGPLSIGTTHRTDCDVTRLAHGGATQHV